MTVLSKRLLEIAGLCRESDILIDVGCDHALIPVSLLEGNSISFAVASDINEGPIRAAEKNAKNAGVSDRMRFVVADGLKGLDPADPLFSKKKIALLISGMGGPLIEKIIKEGENILPLIERFVFSPHSKITEFRRFLGENGFSIRKEVLIREDGKYYFIICCKRGEDTCRDKTDYELGPGFFDEKNDIKREYLKARSETFRNLCENPAIKGEKREEIKEKLLLYEKAAQIYGID